MRLLTNIRENLFFDHTSLARKDPVTARSLAALYDALACAWTYRAGSLDHLEERRLSAPTPGLFHENCLLSLPNDALFLELGEPAQCAAFVLVQALTAARPNERVLDLYVFRFVEDYQRWMWPFIGMRYGPSPECVQQLAVLDQKKLMALAPHAKNALAEEHARTAGLVIAALHEIRAGTLTPEEQPPSPKKASVRATIRPSSFDQNARTRHKKGHSGKGRHRS